MSPNKLMVVMLGAALLLALGCGDSDNTATGGACAADSECAEGKCHAGICVAATPVAKDAACTNNGECKSLICTAGKCAEGVTLKDAACLSSEECASGNCENGKCSLKANGKACTADKECKGGACGDKKCATKCAKDSECASGEVCHSVDMKIMFCMKPTYEASTGKKCGADSTVCAGSTKCYGRANSPSSACSGSCKTDTDCPPNNECATEQGSSFCKLRSACSPCAGDSFCPSGMKCASMFGAKYCTSACTKGGTDCPPASECKDDSDGNPVCMPKAGKCVGDGDNCSPCNHSGQCKSGGQCLSLVLSGEGFCSATCTAGSSTCTNGTSCIKVSSAGAYGCVPSSKGTPAYYTCSSGITWPVYQTNDIFPDFEMVGLMDKDKDGDLKDETLGYVKLSDLATDYKVILFNIMTFW